MRNIPAKIAGFSYRFAGYVFIIGLILAGLSLYYSANNIRVNTDINSLFSPHLTWLQRNNIYDKQFPQFNHSIVGVVSGKTPEAADLTAEALATKMAGDHQNFISVNYPSGSPYFKKNGLLFLSVPQLTALSNQLIAAQPFLGQLAEDPSARGIFSALSLIGEGVKHGQNLTAYHDTLARFAGVLSKAAAGKVPPVLSWQNMLAGSLSAEAGAYRFILFRPAIHQSSLIPGGAAMAAIQKAAETLPFVKDGQAKVELTGAVPINAEQFQAAFGSAVWGLSGSILLIILWLILSVRSFRLTLPMLLTLFVGFALTTGFAVFFVGSLNLISIAFAILFIGLAVDFAIQITVRFRDLCFRLDSQEAALIAAYRTAGWQVLLAAAATAAGFFAFTPTSFSGVAELGMIAGFGMIIAFFTTLFFLPAALRFFPCPPGSLEENSKIIRRADMVLARQKRWILLIFAGLAILGAVAVFRVSFNVNPLQTQNQNTPAMQVLKKLMGQPATNPFTSDVVEPNLATADRVAAELRKLPEVREVLTASDLVPQNQSVKLALINQTAMILMPTLFPIKVLPPPSVAELRISISQTARSLKEILPLLPKQSPLRSIEASLQRLKTATPRMLKALNHALTVFLPYELSNLRTLLTAASPVGIEDFPQGLRKDWLLPDGQARVMIIPTKAAQTSQGLFRFARAVTKIVPDAGGAAVTIVNTGQTIIRAFQEAALFAFLAIIVILSVTLRSVRDMLLVIAPLAMSALLTAGAFILFSTELNFANIIALPLLLGVGVSFNVYFVMNWRRGEMRFLSSPTAHAILFSALATGSAFGSLALSGDPAMSEMGKVLVIGLVSTLISTFIFLPALLRLVTAIRRRRNRQDLRELN